MVPFDLVDHALTQTRAVQRRVREVPSRVVVYLLLAGALFEGLGYQQVWYRLTAGLAPVPAPTASALCQARRRIGAAPLRYLFDLLRGPAATISAATRWRGLLLVAIDGTTMTVPDSPANTAAFGRHRCNHGSSGYPLIRVLALVACGTRTILDVVSGTAGIGETTYAPGLLRAVRAGMLVLADRGFAATAIVSAVRAAGAHMLVRIKNGRAMPILRHYPDGSYLSVMGATHVRVIDAEVTITTSAGRRTGQYRLATTLLDPSQYQACDLIGLYHQRWEIETAYLEIKSSILGGRVLRARTPDGVDQELHALLITYQALRIAMTDATDSRPGTDPDRASFTIALNTARDQLILAAGVIADTVIDLVGTIGRAVLANLLPDRRIRTRARIVKRAISKYNAKGTRVDRTTYKATTSINVLTPPELTPPPPP